MIFSRNRGNAGRHERGRVNDTVTEFDEIPADVISGADRGYGPYDLSEAPEDGQERLDLGALRIPAVAGVEIQLQANPQGQIEQLLLVHGQSRLQLGAFAAPRTEGIWDEIRDLVRTSLTSSGARPEEVEGDYGTEVRARISDNTGSTIIRHVGVDGPRWFVHAVFVGEAAANPQASAELREVLRGLIVDRGTDARPVKETLPLRLPPQAQAQLAQAQGEEAGGVDNARPATARRNSSTARGTRRTAGGEA